MSNLVQEGGQKQPVVEVLAAYHNRNAFDCGEASLNIFLQRQARQNASRNLGVTRVVVPTPGDPHILGYYTLLRRSIERDVLPNPNKFPSDGVGVVLLGRLAVDRSAQDQHIGRSMLLRAIEQTEQAAQNIGIYALVVHALTDEARQWYLCLNFGFKELTRSSRHLYLALDTIRAAGLVD